VGGACSPNGEKREMHIGYWWESQREMGHWEDQDVGGWAIFFRDRLGRCGLDWSSSG
jgi:hypothetical protein